MSYIFFPSASAPANWPLVEVSSDATLQPNTSVIARSTDGIFKVLTLPASPAVGDRLEVFVPFTSLAPIRLNRNGSLIQGQSKHGAIAPGTSTRLVFTQALGWVGDSNLINLADGINNIETEVANGAWAVAPSNLNQTRTIDPNTWTGVGSLDAASGNAEHRLYAWVGPSDYRTAGISYIYCRFRLTATGGSGSLYINSLGRYYGGFLDQDSLYRGIPGSGSVIVAYQGRPNFSPSAERAGIIFAKESANSFCNIEINSLVIL